MTYTRFRWRLFWHINHARVWGLVMLVFFIWLTGSFAATVGCWLAWCVAYGWWLEHITPYWAPEREWHPSEHPDMWRRARGGRSNPPFT